MAESGVHIEDVHFDAKEALDLFVSVPGKDVASMFVGDGHKDLKERLTVLWAHCRDFAQAQGFPAERDTVEYSDFSISGLDAAAYTALTSDAKLAAHLYEVARDKAYEVGEDGDYFECNRILARVEIEISEGVRAGLERISCGLLRPQKNDVGLQFSRATWSLMYHLAVVQDPRSLRNVWKNAVRHHARQSVSNPRWVGLVYSTPKRDHVIQRLGRIEEFDTLESVKKITGAY